MRPAADDTSADDATRATDDHGAVTTLLLRKLDVLEATARARPQMAAPPPIKTKRGKTMPAGDDATPDAIATFGDLLESLDERAFGFVLLLLALPVAVPFLYGVPQIVSIPILAIVIQMMIGRDSPWMPEVLRKRTFSVGFMRKAVTYASRYLGWLERIAAQRLTMLTRGLGAQIVGGLMIIPTISIAVPLPMTNSMPGIGLAIAAVGLIERDGLLVILGLVVALGWVALLLTLGLSGLQLLLDSVF